MRKLQVALDLLSIKDALILGRYAVEGGADIIEVGTPLIKSEGIAAVRKIKDALSVPVIADLKIIDSGSVEARLAFDAGADIVTVLGSATAQTISDAVSVARKAGKKVAVDLIGVYDVISSYNHVLSLGVDYIYLHTGLDEEVEGKMPFDDVNLLFEVSKIPLGVGGGLNAQNICSAIKPGIDIFVVGAAIRCSPDPKAETAKIKRLISGGV